MIIQNERDNEEIGEKYNSPYDDIYKKRMRVKKGGIILFLVNSYLS